MDHKSIIVHLASVMAMVFWGISYIWSKSVFEYYDPLSTIFLRLAVSSLFLMLFVKLSRIRMGIKKHHLPLLLLSSVLNPFLYFLGENYGLEKVSPAISSAIIATIPVFTPLSAFMILNERINRLNITGLFISFTGVLVLILEPNLKFSASVTGVLLLFGAVVAATGYGLIVRKLSPYYPAASIVAWQNMLGLIWFFPLIIFTNRVQIFLQMPPPEIALRIAALGIFASSLAFILFTYSIRNLGISRASLYSNLIPLFTAMFSILFFREALELKTWIGIGLITGGVTLTQIRSFRFFKIS